MTENMWENQDKFNNSMLNFKKSLVKAGHKNSEQFIHDTINKTVQCLKGRKGENHKIELMKAWINQNQNKLTS